MTWGLIGVGAASAVAAVTTGILSLKAKSDFDETTQQREAHEANQRYVNFGTASLVTAGVAVGSALLAWWLWPEEKKGTLTKSAQVWIAGGSGVSANFSW